MKTSLSALLLGSALGFSTGIEAETEPSRTAFVDFNTQCARCHEGECSGRLSFSSGSEAAANHLRRYLGTVSEGEIQQLYALLRYTKEDCRIYPFQSTAAPNWLQGTDDLEAWRNSAQSGYFVPLGEIESGMRSLELQLEGADLNSWRVVNAEHETLAEGRFCPRTDPDSAIQASFNADGQRLYLHLEGKSRISRLSIR
jgi:hypothetical protein